MPTDNRNQGQQKDRSTPNRKSDERSAQGKDGKSKDQDKSREPGRK